MPIAPGQPEPQTQPDTIGTHGRRLAVAHKERATGQALDVKPALLAQLETDAQTLALGYRHFVSAATADLSRAGEWILDNFYVIREAIRGVRKDLPARYYRELPKIRSGSGGRQPRIYDIADELIRNSGAELALEPVRRFLAGYEEISTLTMGELWALPIMIRIATIRNLSQAIERILRTANTASARGRETEQGEDRIVASCVRTLRMLDIQDWNEFFETVSSVEQCLRRDPAGIHGKSDFGTRDRSRKSVESLARASGQSEQEVARRAVRLAESADSRAPGDERRGNVSFYLLDKGLFELERTLQYRPGARVRLKRTLKRSAVPVYLLSIALLTVVLLSLSVAAVAAAEGTIMHRLAAAVLLLVPSITVSVSLVNWSVTRILAPGVLPKMDFREGIPPDSATVVVIPALLTDDAEVDSLVGQLEQHYLSNPDPNLAFALLSDFADAPEKDMPADAELLDRTRTGIQKLHEKYGTGRHPRFWLLHRERQWNPAERVWMGWERKRGKLHELNRLLRGARDTSFKVQITDAGFYSGVQYVITLDADTVLPAAAGNRLVGTLAHPLNRARFDSSGRLFAGFTVLQPRAQIKPTSANRSSFTRVFAGDTGLDPYTRAVSDVYQDLFGDGIFVGKGIYDIDAFELSTKDRVPENALLSHDLFEGIHGRVGLVTDISVLEDFPPHYLSYMQRTHRWIRGDWQLLPWLFRQVPHAGPGRIRNVHSWLARWKIFDNLRRSLLAPSLLAWLTAAWLLIPGSPWVWTLAAILVLGTPAITSLFDRLRSPAESLYPEAIREGARWLLAVAFLPYEALVSVDAVGTTLWRLIFTRRRLLQWTTAAHAARLFGSQKGPRLAWAQMAGSVAFVGILAVAIGVLRLESLTQAVPILVLWLASPQITYWISLPIRKLRKPIDERQLRELRLLARRTWLFFEQFVGPEDNWLPPDNYQERPLGVVAHRTSPTNIGMFIMSAIGAYDLGYIGSYDLTLRIRSVLDTLGGLELYRGHLLNWYNTQSLQPLPPRYVSTVDSGNLAAALIVLRQAFLGFPSEPVMRVERWDGLTDTLELLASVTRAVPVGNGKYTALQAQLTLMRGEIAQARNNVAVWAEVLSTLSGRHWDRLNDLLIGFIEAHSASLDVGTLRNLRDYSQTIRRQMDTMQRRLLAYLSWLPLLAHPPELFGSEDGQAGPSPGGEAAGIWNELRRFLCVVPTVGEIAGFCTESQRILTRLDQALNEVPADPRLVEQARSWCSRTAEALGSASGSSQTLLTDYLDIVNRTNDLFESMEFGFLFNRQRGLFHIGYNIDAGAPDANYYDLLASEARIASYIAIARGDVPHTHWMKLGRPLTRVLDKVALLSWSGTMFEYLMAGLWMHVYPNTLLYESAQAAVHYQKAYPADLHMPWGTSESGYFRFDAHQNYQYKAFGTAGLGLKRGLEEDSVFAPYASVLALSWDVEAVLQNIERLSSMGMMARYGLYEAIDFTDSHLPKGRRYEPVRSFMSHHQGMILVSLVNYLRNDIMVRRFHEDPRMQSNELLLQEQIPRRGPVDAIRGQQSREQRTLRAPATINPWLVPEAPPVPLVHVLSNGTYGVVLTSAGGGYSYWGKQDLTRWRADSTLEDWGTWIYIRNQDTGELWSATLQPTAVEAETGETFFDGHQVEFRRRVHGVLSRTDVTVSPDRDVEIRRITLLNESGRPRRLAIVSYGEIVLAPQAADLRHQAFNKLFLESEYVRGENTLIFKRRPRSENEDPVFLVHKLTGDSLDGSGLQFETDRLSFLGRGGTTRAPAALSGRILNLSGHTGATLDPVMVIGTEIELDPHGSMQLAFVTAAAESRERALDLARTHTSLQAIELVFQQARHQAQIDTRKLELDTVRLESTQRLLSALLYPGPALRADYAVLSANSQGQPGLWSYGISGDFPIVMARISAPEQTPFVEEMLRAHAWWRSHSIRITLVLLNEHDRSYRQDLHELLIRLLARTGNETWLNRHDGIFIIRADQLPDSDRVLLETAARAVMDAGKGNLSEQTRPMLQPPVRLPALVPSLQEQKDRTPPLTRPPNLAYENGFGGFSTDAKEYVIFLPPGASTPAPWINVIANADFGFLVSESGMGCTWAQNSGENRLTPWRNDPVSDAPAEALYLRDEETGEVWSPTPLPAPAPAPYLIRHGAGYTAVEHRSRGLDQHLRLFAAVDAPVKIIQFRLENLSDRPRRITVTCFADWVLGTARDITQQYIIPEFDSETGALLARNPYNPEFGRRVAFLASNKPPHGVTADRTEFLGRLGSLARPAALHRIGLSSTVRPGIDSCAALQLHVDLDPGKSEEMHFLIGEGTDREEALGLVKRYRMPEHAEADRQSSRRFWDASLGAISVRTPDPSMDIMLNRWLLYQSLACRIWGRSALYQSSGAFGYRDQLQDVLALSHALPQVARNHILEAARRQFEAGDVLHWWHPPSGRGIRTRCSDDLLWLPYVTAHYVSTTGDHAILEEQVPFLKGATLKPDEDERYGSWESSEVTATLFEHCKRAIQKGATAGPRGLPLIGTGDWNDGFNLVGAAGRGESVWLGWFLCDTLNRFVPICEKRGDGELARRYTMQSRELLEKLESQGWDGRWYRRGYYDDGAVLGSGAARECRIDSIAQSWAVLSGAADATRARRGMEAVWELLVKETDGIVLLFTPPFDHTSRDPGYVKGYPPGIRENGGQYTHAATWAGWAFSEMGDGNRAWQIFNMLNPIRHANREQAAARYRLEPYVVAADVYSAPPHVARGGWSWYTGSASWMYRLGIEAILGLRRRGELLYIEPAIPDTWEGFEVRYRLGSTEYAITFKNASGNPDKKRLLLDGELQESGAIRLVQDGRRHDVLIE